MKKLSKKEAKLMLKDLKGWKLYSKYITKKFKFDNFVQTVKFLDKIVPKAEKLYHHPDIIIKNYNQLIIKITTHDVGGLTELDFKLAKEIEKIKMQNLYNK